VRPVSLTVEGLTAFRHPQHIDLSGLDLFVITGPTGAGKTSILDAMTFALYGSVVRVKSGEMRDLITHNASVVRVELNFEIQGSAYRVIRRMKRKGQPDALLERKEGDEFISVVDTPGTKAIDRYVADLLGLDFPAFTKAVLLPQGRFHEFLSGDADARRTILSRLLELERYSQMGSLARQKAKDIGTGLAERASYLEQDYGDATIERLTELRTRVREAEALAVLTATARERAASVAAESQRHADLTAQIETDATTLRRIVGEISSVELTARQSEERDRETLAAVESAGAQLEDTDAAEAAAHRALHAALDQTGGDEVALTAALNQARLLGSESERLAEVGSRLKDLREQLTAATTALADATKTFEQAEVSVEEARERGETLRTAQELATQVLKLAQGRERLAAIDAEVDCLNELLASATAEREKARASLDHFRTAHRAEALRSELHAGDPCPVCEQVVSALPGARADLEQLLTEAQSRLKASEQGQAEAQEAVSERRREQHAVKTRVDELETAISADAPRLSAPDAESSLARLTQELVGAREAFPAKNDALKEARTKVQKARDVCNTAATRTEEWGREQEGLANRIGEAKRGLSPLFGDDIPADAEEQVSRRLTLVIDIRGQLKIAQDTSAAARASVARARADREEFERGLQLAIRRIEQLRGEARGCIGAFYQRTSQPDSVAVPQAADGEALARQALVLGEFCSSTLEQAEAAKRRASDAAASCDSTLVEIAHQVGLEPARPSARELVLEIEEVSRAADLAFRDRSSQYDQLELRIARRTEIESSMTVDRRRQEMFQRLGLELHADRFLAYILGESMRTLAAQATSELKLITGGRYSIAAKESNFEVIDHDNADERRSVATLSGGETFLASLALALALSGSVRDLAGNAAAARLESMFIDEGFGALDAETLDTAVGALENLAGEHRMIGVISHVPALAERIQHGIEVRKVGASSTISRR